jgi:single-strand DNA-binding protein
MTVCNKVIITGKVAALSQRHYRPDGSPVIQFSMELDAADSTLREARGLPRPEQVRGNRKHFTNQTGSGSLIDVVAFGEWAESKLDLLSSGQHLLVVGRLNQRHWQTPEGRKKTCMEVIATDLQMAEETNQPSALPGTNNGNTGSTERGEKNEKTF